MVHFIGAGPGDPELITIKGQRLIEEADIIIFAGSLVNPAVLEKRRKDSVVYDSAYMSLDEVMDVTIPAVKAGKTVARVHTGDPSIYGAIREQMVRLDAEKIEYDVIPGVSSFCASAAAVKKEFTLPSVSQTVIITRMEGRTPVPPKEKLIDLAKHHASMCIFLSVGFMDELTKTLMEAGYEPETPMAVVYRASWPEQKIV
ncbi:MAG: precorrin-4 C(11)-methyltransferase, partial [archaeon]|nr:precorrin-4 C(11)-methyltransferase [archaeon]